MKRIILVILLGFVSSPLFGDNVIFGLSEANSLVSDTNDMAFSKEKFSLEASYQNWMPKTSNLKFYNIGLGARFGKFGLSLNSSYIPGKSYAVNTNQNYTPVDLYLGLGASYLIDNMALSVKVNYYSSKLAPSVSYTGFGFGLFGAYKINDVILGLGVQNLGPKVKSKSGVEFYLPAAAVLNGKYHTAFDSIGLETVLEAKYYFNGALAANLGLIADYKDLIFLNLSYNYGGNNAPIPSYASLGLGVKFYGVKLQAAYYLASKTLSNTMTIGLGYSF